MRIKYLCILLLTALTACAGYSKGGGMIGDDKAWCSFYGTHCEKENNPQCSIWGRCDE
jgi:hypothetical protein